MYVLPLRVENKIALLCPPNGGKKRAISKATSSFRVGPWRAASPEGPFGKMWPVTKCFIVTFSDPILTPDHGMPRTIAGYETAMQLIDHFVVLM
jgi:hypothetical protein